MTYEFDGATVFFIAVCAPFLLLITLCKWAEWDARRWTKTVRSYTDPPYIKITKSTCGRCAYFRDGKVCTYKEVHPYALMCEAGLTEKDRQALTRIRIWRD